MLECSEDTEETVSETGASRAGERNQFVVLTLAPESYHRLAARRIV